MLSLLFGMMFGTQVVDVRFDFQGGGVKGLGSATIFRAIAERVKTLVAANPSFGSVTVLDMVNTFSGVSAGSIQATLLAYTKAFSTEPTQSIDDVLKLMTDYTVIQKQIQDRACCGCCCGLLGYQYDPEPLINWLHDQLGDKTLGGLKAKGVTLEVLGHNMSLDSPILFSTEKDAQKSLKLWEIVMASAAFPTGFPACEIKVAGGGSIIVCDGGLSAKDLSLSGVRKAKKDDIVVLLGTGDTLVDPNQAKNLQFSGKLGWLLAKMGDVISRIIDGNTEYSLEEAAALAKKEDVKFFPFQYDTHGQTLDRSDANLDLIKGEVTAFLNTAETKTQLDELAELLVENYQAKQTAKAADK